MNHGESVSVRKYLIMPLYALMSLFLRMFAMSTSSGESGTGSWSSICIAWTTCRISQIGDHPSGFSISKQISPVLLSTLQCGGTRIPAFASDTNLIVGGTIG